MGKDDRDCPVVASQIDALLSGGGNVTGTLGDTAGSLGGLFGKK